MCAVLVKSVDIANRGVRVERTLSGSTYMETTKNKSKDTVRLNDKALEIVKRNIVGKFPKDFLFANPITGRGYARKERPMGDLEEAFGNRLRISTRPQDIHSARRIVPLADSS